MIAARVAVLVSVLALTGPVAATEIVGAGATFPYPIYARWAETYKKSTGNEVNYQSVGSGAGIKQIQAKTVIFGATDAPMSGQALEESGLLQFPMVMGGIVPVVNLAGVSPGQMVLDGPTLAKIYLGDIKTWDDPALKTLNPGVPLEAVAIHVVHRADGSGTTFNFTDYLSKVSAGFKAKVGSATAVEWPVGIGAKGNDGVANNVAQTQNSIGYVEYSYAKQSKMSHTRMINADGKSVSPDMKSFTAAAASADWAGTPGFGVVLSNQKGADSWPMTAATFILVHKQPLDPVAAREALKFFDWAYRQGDAEAQALDYIPMPEPVVIQIEKSWEDIQDGTGKKIFAPGG